MQKRMRKSRFSLNCLVRSETSRHVQICFISAKQCAQLQIAKNQPLWQKREENNNLAKIAYSFTATLWEKTPPKHKFTQTALIGQKRARHFSISHFCAKQSAQLRIAENYCLFPKTSRKQQTDKESAFVNLPKLFCVVNNI